MSHGVCVCVMDNHHIYAYTMSLKRRNYTDQTITKNHGQYIYIYIGCQYYG